MKKFDFSFGEGREALTRDQMKLVKGGGDETGGEGERRATCTFHLTTQIVTQVCNGSTISQCRDYTVHNMHNYELEYHDHYDCCLECH